MQHEEIIVLSRYLFEVIFNFFVLSYKLRVIERRQGRKSSLPFPREENQDFLSFSLFPLPFSFSFPFPFRSPFPKDGSQAFPSFALPPSSPFRLPSSLPFSFPSSHLFPYPFPFPLPFPFPTLYTHDFFI